MNIKLSFAIVFISGIAVTALEISSARIAAPFFGSTIYVWGGAIGTVLAALAIGYWLGGKIIDRLHTQKTIFWTLIVAGLTIELIPLIYVPINSYISSLATNQYISLGVLVVFSMLGLFLIPLVCLGMISPMVLRLSLNKVEEVGRLSGILSGGATFGSILGTFLSAYWSIPYFGTRATIITSGILLLLLALFVNTFSKKLAAVSLLILTLTIVQSSITQYSPRPHVIWSKESPYQFVQVIENHGLRYLVHDSAIAAQSYFATDHSFSNGPYDVFAILPFMKSSTSVNRSVLLIGLGGGNMVHLYQRALANQFTFDITAVEIDPDVVLAAREKFDLQQAEATVVVDDARHYLRNTKKQYDIIIVDAYTHEAQIPPMLATREFFQEVQHRLTPGGVLSLNAYVLPGSRYFNKLATTVSQVFPDVRFVPFTEKSSNNLLLAGERLFLDKVPEQLAANITVDVHSLIQRMKRVPSTGESYTDDKTDLEIRVRPFITRAR